MERLLTEHLSRWLGGRLPASGLDVIGAPQREKPGWDGRIHPALGVSSPEAGVLSVPPHAAVAVAERYAEDKDLAVLGPQIPALVGFPERGWFTAVYRWTTDPAPLPDAGAWVPADAPGVPEWLWPFGGEVLVATDPATGAHLAGVGVKRHDAYGHELAVVTAPEARGQGLARRLVAQAARRVLDEGALPTYMHAPDNRASAAVAEAAGFRDLGWRAYGTTEAR
ncbi:GNAT family N-acetyltransferase [Nonomuraea sp. FMUSA5-5]|uniref:GNAT family N-acetyltransferase n=1 Tax=Nonomuraea composti TaxID=2720023 RepID=A0ABX1BPE5_9ACTN|nr:GNAT family N-acetyltransferase [Nonomuraea sp. FMUSA5-5]NJP97666.1 GNAT family N-acetyltransferase [Nonomuraea sp. FMUSA5-5]